MTSTSDEEPIPAAPPDQVLLIHGTFAQSKEYWRRQTWWWGRLGRRGQVESSGADHSEELAWWRAGGEFAAAFDRLGRGRFACSTEEFHWSGANKESNRLVAGARLLERLETLQRQGRSYHLIGHSHGGSVIWHALTQAARRGRRLPGLRGWTTVGSPFLQFRPLWRDLWLLIPLTVYVLLGVWIYRPLAMVLEHRHDLASSDYTTISVLCALLLLHAGALILLLLRVMAILTAVWEERREQTSRRRAWEAFGPGWRGLWSLGDEAIGGLAGSLGLGGSVAPRFPGIDTVRVEGFRGALTFLPRVIYLGTFGTLYNVLIAPNIDRFIWRTTTAQLHGNDRGGVGLVAVWNSPVGNTPADAGLPPDIDGLLVAEADRQAAQVLRELRAALGQSAATASNLSTLTSILGGRFASQGLIHTSYFRWPEVQALLAYGIAARQSEGQGVTDSVNPPEVSPSEVVQIEPRPKQARPTPRLAWALPVALILLPLLIASYASTALRNSLRPYTVEYQIQQIVNDAPVASVASVSMPDSDPDALIPLGNSVREDREIAARYREVANYSRALADLGFLERAVDAVLECGYTPPQGLTRRLDEPLDFRPLETLLRSRDEGRLDQVRVIARRRKGQEQNANLFMAVAHEHARRRQLDRAWAAGREALRLFPPKSGLESYGPSMPKTDLYATFASSLAVAGVADPLFDEIRAMGEPDLRLATWLKLGTSLTENVWATPESYRLADLTLAEVLPHWVDPQLRGHSVLTRSLPDHLISLLIRRGRFREFGSLQEALVRESKNGPANTDSGIDRAYLTQLRESCPIDPEAVRFLFAMCQDHPDSTESLLRWNNLCMTLLEYGNWSDSDEALRHAFVALESLKKGSQDSSKSVEASAHAEQAQAPVVLASDLMANFRALIYRMRQAGRSEDVITSAVSRFAEIFGQSYDPLATGGVGDRIAEGIVLRDRLSGHTTSGLGADAHPIALAVLAEVFRNGDPDQGPGWACWAVHEAIRLRAGMNSERARRELDRILQERYAIEFDLDDPDRRYVKHGALRPKILLSSTALTYSPDVANQIFWRMAPALARAGLESDAAATIDRITDDPLRHATWNEALPHMLSEREPDRHDESRLPLPIRREMRLLEVMDLVAKHSGGNASARAVPRAVIEDFDAVLSAGEWTEISTLVQRPLTDSGRSWLLAHFVRQGRRADALSLLRSGPVRGAKDDVRDPSVREAALAMLQNDLLAAEQFEPAVEVASLRESVGSLTVPLVDVCEAIARRGRFDLARKAADALVDPAQRAQALAGLCWHLRQGNWTEEAARTLDAARRAAQKIPLPSNGLGTDPNEPDWDPRPGLLAQLRLARVETRQASEACIGDVLGLGRLAKSDDRLGMIHGPFSVFEGLSDYYTWVARNLRELGLSGPARSALDLALEETRTIKEELARSRAIASIAEEICRNGQFSKARQVVTPCLARDKLRAYTAILQAIILSTKTP